MDEFIRSKSMLTPGVAGMLVLLIAGISAELLGWPGPVVALGLSFLLGLLVWADSEEIHFINRLILYVLNSTIIFTTAFGIHEAATAAFAEPPPVTRAAPPEDGSTPFLKSWSPELTRTLNRLGD